MSMTISGHAAASGFEAPLEVLSGCHRRVERQCATCGDWWRICSAAIRTKTHVLPQQR
jgi:hypothetical protein